jgi:hypothetical protein
LCVDGVAKKGRVITALLPEVHEAQKLGEVERAVPWTRVSSSRTEGGEWFSRAEAHSHSADTQTIASGRTAGQVWVRP